MEIIQKWIVQSNNIMKFYNEATDQKILLDRIWSYDKSPKKSDNLTIVETTRNSE